MSDSFYGGQRRKRRPKDRPFFRDKDPREPHGVRGDSSYSDSKDKAMGILTSPVMKAPVILAKPDSIPKQQLNSPSPVEEISTTERFNHSRHERPSSHTIEGKHYYGTSKGSNLKSYPVKSTPIKSGSNYSHNQDQTSSKLVKDSTNEQKPVKLIDSSLRWTDSGSEFLEENQTHFLVVGILGEQGVGKSSLMSYLAGGDFLTKDSIFPCQGRENMERANNKTMGIDMYITEERIIFLDSQPILSPALLEQCIYNDRKLSGDFNGPAAGIEMQSLQIVSFLFSVCHVVIVLQDWFGDTRLFNFLQCAEMLRLTSPASSDSSHGDNDSEEFYPHLVFVYNKAEPDLFDPMNVKAMSRTISSKFAHSKLLYKGSVSLQKSSLFPELSIALPLADEVNLFLIPTINNADLEQVHSDASLSDDSYFQTFPNYGDLPNSTDILKTLQKMILSIRNIPLTHKQLTEKNWYYYAAKMWEAIKKSQMMAEFNRLIV